MEKFMTLFAVVIGLLSAMSAAAREKGALDVVAVYYPHWHKYPKGTEWFGEKWDEGEWAFVRTATPGSVPSSGSSRERHVRQSNFRGTRVTV